MPCLFCPWRRSVVVALLLPAVLGVPVANAEIFKCVAKDGSPLYQNFPCYMDSLGSPSSALAAKAPSTAGNPEPLVRFADVESTRSQRQGQLRVGMTSDDLRALLGEPREIVSDEPAEGGSVSLWRYADGRTVQLDHQHRVIQLPRY